MIGGISHDIDQAMQILFQNTRPTLGEINALRNLLLGMQDKINTVVEPTRIKARS